MTAASNPLNTATYQYDALDRRTAKTVNGVTTQFLHDGGLEIADYDGTGALLRRYVYGLGLAPVAEVSAAGIRRFLHADGVGSVVAVTDATGIVVERHGYGPYGEGASIVGVAFRFTGHRYDPETGLHYMRARYYSASLGRFLSPDPIGYGDGPHLYRYAGNSPVSFFDPLGLLGAVADGLGSPANRVTEDGPTQGFVAPIPPVRTPTLTSPPPSAVGFLRLVATRALAVITLPLSLSGSTPQNMPVGQGSRDDDPSRTYNRYMGAGELVAIEETGFLRGGSPGRAITDYYESASQAHNRLALPVRPEIGVNFRIVNNPVIVGPGPVDSVVLRDGRELSGRGTEYYSEMPVQVEVISVWPLGE